MRDTSTQARHTVIAIGVIALAGFLLRAAAFLASDGPNGVPSHYDDAVYFSASALLVRGVIPYRDFVFVQPPGGLFFFAPLAWLSSSATGFALARMGATTTGAANIALAGLIAFRAAGPVAGIAAAALYAVYPDVVTVERSTYLEPLLNLAALLSAMVWLRHEGQRARPLRAGALCGAACAVKFWGVIWLIAAAFSAARGRFLKDFVRFVGGAALACFLLAGPLALVAPQKFFEQTLRFQLHRPADGTLQMSARLGEIFGSGHRTASVLALVGIASSIVALLKRRATHEERYFTVAVLVTIAGFIASSSYWPQYNAHLAASQCVLAGIGAAALLRIPRSTHLAVAACLVLLFAILDGRSLRNEILSTRARSAELMTAGNAIRAIVPPNEPVFAFDPAWTLAANRLPPFGDGAAVIVDSYDAMLLEAVQGGTHFPDTSAAFQTAPRQNAVLQRLLFSRYAVLGRRGPRQLSAADRLWFTTRFRCVNPEAGDLCVWKNMDAEPLSQR